jgi:hypothetical protein
MHPIPVLLICGAVALLPATAAQAKHHSKGQDSSAQSTYQPGSRYQSNSGTPIRQHQKKTKHAGNSNQSSASGTNQYSYQSDNGSCKYKYESKNGRVKIHQKGNRTGSSFAQQQLQSWNAPPPWVMPPPMR